jgi:hypothetical protein
MVADELHCLIQLRIERAKRVLVRKKSSEYDDAFSDQLAQLLKSHPGQCPIVLVYETPSCQAEFLLGEAWRVEPNEYLMEQLAKLMGQVSIQYQ